MNNGIYIDDIPFNLFLDYFTDDNISTTNYTPIMEAQQARCWSYTIDGRNLILPRDELLESDATTNSISFLYGTTATPSYTDGVLSGTDVGIYNMYGVYYPAIRQEISIPYRYSIVYPAANKSVSAINILDATTYSTWIATVSPSSTEDASTVQITDLTNSYYVNSDGTESSTATTYTLSAIDTSTSGYTEWYLLSTAGVRIAKLVEHTTKEYQKISPTGLLYYTDENGLTVLTDSEDSVFKKYHDSYTAGYYGLLDADSKLIYNLIPGVLGMVNDGDNNKIEYYETYVHTTTWEKITDTEDITATEIAIPRSITTSIGDTIYTTVNETIKNPIVVDDIGSLPVSNISRVEVLSGNELSTQLFYFPKESESLDDATNGIFYLYHSYIINNKKKFYMDNKNTIIGSNSRYTYSGNVASDTTVNLTYDYSISGITYEFGGTEGNIWNIIGSTIELFGKTYIISKVNIDGTNAVGITIDGTICEIKYNTGTEYDFYVDILKTVYYKNSVSDADRYIGQLSIYEPTDTDKTKYNILDSNTYYKLSIYNPTIHRCTVPEYLNDSSYTLVDDDDGLTYVKKTYYRNIYDLTEYYMVTDTYIDNEYTEEKLKSILTYTSTIVNVTTAVLATAIAKTASTSKCEVPTGFRLNRTTNTNSEFAFLSADGKTAVGIHDMDNSTLTTIIPTSIRDDITMPCMKYSRLISLFKNAGQYIKSGILELRGGLLSNNTLYNMKVSAYERLLASYINSDDDTLAISYTNDTDQLTSMDIFAEGYYNFISSDTNTLSKVLSTNITYIDPDDLSRSIKFEKIVQAKVHKNIVPTYTLNATAELSSRDTYKKILNYDSYATDKEYYDYLVDSDTAALQYTAHTLTNSHVNDYDSIIDGGYFSYVTANNFLSYTSKIYNKIFNEALDKTSISDIYIDTLYNNLYKDSVELYATYDDSKIYDSTNITDKHVEYLTYNDDLDGLSTDSITAVLDKVYSNNDSTTEEIQWRII